MGLLSSLFGGKSSEEKQAATQEEKNFDTLKYDGIRARNIHQLPYAIKCFENAIRLKEEPETMMLLANAYLQTDATDDARTTLDRLVEIQPDHLENLLALARVCYLQADYKSMDIACQKAIKLDETNATSYYMAAQAYRGLQNPGNNTGRKDHPPWRRSGRRKDRSGRRRPAPWSPCRRTASCPVWRSGIRWGREGCRCGADSRCRDGRFR